MPNNVSYNPCPIYQKHHNIIDGISTVRRPYTWDEVTPISEIDGEDEDGQLRSLFIDIKVFDIEDLPNFTNPPDKINIADSVFIIRRDGKYYLCERQTEDFVKFAIDISHLDFIKDYDRAEKINKIYGKHESTIDSQ